jgi:intracellular septation protein
MNNKKVKSPFVKSMCELAPLIVFFAVYKMSGGANPIVDATIALLIVTFFTLALNYLVNKELAAMPLFSAIILAIFGSLTIFSGDEIFIKMKPTLLNALFAAILLFGYFTQRPFLKMLLGHSMELKKEIWLNLSLRWALFFVFLGVLNEIIWRNFSTDLWVQFKVFGMLPISIIFTLSQVPYILKHKQDKSS